MLLAPPPWLPEAAVSEAAVVGGTMYRSAGVAMAWNVFRFCTALRGLGSIMILLVLAIVGVTYYAVVLCNYGPALLTGGGTTLAAFAVLLLFHFLVRILT